MLLNYLALLKEIGVLDLFDICASACVLWFGFTVFQFRRTWKIGAGLVCYGLILLIASELELALTYRLLQGLFAVVVLVVVVVYQNELRRVLKELTQMFFARNRAPLWHGSVSELLVKVAYELSARRWGALIVLPGRIELETLITEGFKLDGVINRPLLMSLFDPHSPGHDGALVVRGERIELFGSRLPLTERDEQLNEKGTRHAAAVGLTEKCDALVLVVSEESGNISIAREGNLKLIADSQSLLSELREFRRRAGTPELVQTRSLPYLRMALRMFFALIVTSVFWLVLVPGSAVVTTSFDVPIEVQNIPEGYTLASVTPPTATVALTGERRALFKLRDSDLLISLDGTLTALGRQTYSLNSSQMMVPADLEVDKISPASVKVLVDRGSK